jgi:hypothetical protein
MQNFLEDKVINRLNGYYLLLYANDRKIIAFFINCFNSTFVSFIVFFRLIPPRIKYRD